MAVGQPALDARKNPAVSARQWITLLSPLAVIGICQAAARWLTPVFGDQTIYPWLLIYWVVTGAWITWGAGWTGIQRWGGRPLGSWLWSALAVIFLPITLPIFFDGWRMISAEGMWLPWLLFAPINSLFEEGYWRGLLLDAARPQQGRAFPGWAAVLYSSLFFSLNHASLGGFVKAYASPMAMVTPILAGLIYGLVYWKTHSLRWAFASHTLVNWFGLGILVLLNIYIPPMP